VLSSLIHHKVAFRVFKVQCIAGGNCLGILIHKTNALYVITIMYGLLEILPILSNGDAISRDL
jgi:hypothetical protein